MEQIDQHERPLPYPEVAPELLAVATAIANQVEEVVLYLERGSQEESEADEAVEPALASRPDERTDAARIDGRVPTGLLQDHPKVVGLAQVDRVVAAPAELDGLPLHGLARHTLRLLEHAQRDARAQ